MGGFCQIPSLHSCRRSRYQRLAPCGRCRSVAEPDGWWRAWPVTGTRTGWDPFSTATATWKPGKPPLTPAQGGCFMKGLRQNNVRNWRLGSADINGQLMRHIQTRHLRLHFPWPRPWMFGWQIGPSRWMRFQHGSRDSLHSPTRECSCNNLRPNMPKRYLVIVWRSVHLWHTYRIL